MQDRPANINSSIFVRYTNCRLCRSSAGELPWPERSTCPECPSDIHKRSRLTFMTLPPTHMTSTKLPLPIELQPVASNPLEPISDVFAESLRPGSRTTSHVSSGSRDGTATSGQGVESTSLPPVDSGPAFIFLAAATVLEYVWFVYVVIARSRR